MPGRMIPKFPKGTRVIHTDSYNYKFKGVVSRAKRVKGQDFFTYDVSVTEKQQPDESQWQPYSGEKFDVSDYSLAYDTGN